MVYEKKQSGDPDYDDKVPLSDHAVTLVRAGDGTVIGRMDPALGPVSPDGAHVNLVDPHAEELDTRPAPGEVAEVKATVQTYTPEDVPHEEISVDEALASREDAPPAPTMTPDPETGGVKVEQQATPTPPAEPSTVRQAPGSRPTPAKKATAAKK